MNRRAYSRPIYLLLLGLIVPLAATAQNLTGRQIMELVDARDDGDLGSREMRMLLIDKNGAQRTRLLQGYSRDVGDDEETVLYFLAPADVKGTGFLTHDFDDDTRDDEQWLYLPALRKTKRIASGDQSGSFMGTDFTFADLNDRRIDLWDYERLDDGAVRGASVWVVEAIPNTDSEIDRTGYTKQVLFVDQSNHLVLRAKSWLESGGKTKYLDVRTVEQVDGIWVATEVHMTTKKGKQTFHKTVLTLDNVRFGQDLEEAMFRPAALEKGL